MDLNLKKMKKEVQEDEKEEKLLNQLILRHNVFIQIRKNHSDNDSYSKRKEFCDKFAIYLYCDTINLIKNGTKFTEDELYKAMKDLLETFPDLDLCHVQYNPFKANFFVPLGDICVPLWELLSCDRYFKVKDLVLDKINFENKKTKNIFDLSGEERFINQYISLFTHPNVIKNAKQYVIQSFIEIAKRWDFDNEQQNFLLFFVIENYGIRDYYEDEQTFMHKTLIERLRKAFENQGTPDFYTKTNLITEKRDYRGRTPLLAAMDKFELVPLYTIRLLQLCGYDPSCDSECNINSMNKKAGNHYDEDGRGFLERYLSIRNDIHCSVSIVNTFSETFPESVTNIDKKGRNLLFNIIPRIGFGRGFYRAQQVYEDTLKDFYTLFVSKGVDITKRAKNGNTFFDELFLSFPMMLQFDFPQEDFKNLSCLSDESDIAYNQITHGLEHASNGLELIANFRNKFGRDIVSFPKDTSCFRRYWDCVLYNTKNIGGAFTGVLDLTLNLVEKGKLVLSNGPYDCFIETLLAFLTKLIRPRGEEFIINYITSLFSVSKESFYELNTKTRIIQRLCTTFFLEWNLKRQTDFMFAPVFSVLIPRLISRDDIMKKFENEENLFVFVCKCFSPKLKSGKTLVESCMDKKFIECFDEFGKKFIPCPVPDKEMRVDIYNLTFQKYQKYRLIMLARSFDTGCVFYKDLFPLDLFKEVVYIAFSCYLPERIKQK